MNRSSAPTAALDRLAIGVACLFLAILPITHTVALRHLALGVIAILALRLAWRERPVNLPLRLPLAAWALIAGLSLFWSIDPDYSQGEWRKEVIYPTVAFLVFFFLVQKGRALRFFVGALFCSGGVAALIAISFYFSGGAWRTTSTFGVGDAGAYSTYAALVLPVFVISALNKELRVLPPVGSWLIIFLVLAAAALTRNRALWLTLAVAMVTYILLHWRDAEIVMAGKRRAAVLISALLALLATGFFTIHMEKASRWAPDGSAVTFMAEDARLQIWEYAVERIGERPLLGHGFGRGILRQDFRQTLQVKRHWHGHNMFVNSALMLGVVGLGVFLWLLFALFRALWRRHMAADPTARSLGMLGLTVLTSMLVKNQFDDLLIRENSLLFWSLMGICLGAGGRISTKSYPCK